MLHLRPTLPRFFGPLTKRGLTTTSTASKSPRNPLFYTLGALTAAGGVVAGYTLLPSASTKLNPETFTPYTLTRLTPITVPPSIPTSIFSLTPPSPPAPFSPDHIQSIQIKNPQVMIVRHYTPITTDSSNLKFLIKKEPSGEMSRYIFSLPAGSEVELRGPYNEYTLPPAGSKVRLLFLAGGTGIAPALQCAEKLLSASPDAGMRVLWAVRNRGETQGAAAEIVEGLKRKFPGRLEVGVFCDSEGGVRKEVVGEAVKGWGADRVVVSGPEGFVRYWAGEKGEWVGGIEGQGRLGGVLKGVVGKGTEVWKL